MNTRTFAIGRAILLFCSTVLLTLAVPAQQKAPLPEMWTRLAARIDSASLKAGDTVRLRVVQSWVYQTCGVDQGTTIPGRVLSVASWSPSSKATEVAIGFTAPCLDGTHAPLVLIAAFYADADPMTQMDIYNSMPQGIGPGASGRRSTNLGTLPSSANNSNSARWPAAQFGEVKGLRHLSLKVAKGPQSSTILATTDKALRLEPGTRIALIPIPRQP